MTRRDWSFIYVIQMTGGFIKVGTAFSPEKRLCEVQTCNPARVRLAFTRCVPVDSAYWIEDRAHRRLEKFHVRGEWFKCTLSEARLAVLDSISEGIEWANQRRAKHRNALAATAREKRTANSNVDSGAKDGQIIAETA